MEVKPYRGEAYPLAHVGDEGEGQVRPELEIPALDEARVPTLDDVGPGGPGNVVGRRCDLHGDRALARGVGGPIVVGAVDDHLASHVHHLRLPGSLEGPQPGVVDRHLGEDGAGAGVGAPEPEPGGFLGGRERRQEGAVQVGLVLLGVRVVREGVHVPVRRLGADGADELAVRVHLVTQLEVLLPDGQDTVGWRVGGGGDATARNVEE